MFPTTDSHRSHRKRKSLTASHITNLLRRSTIWPNPYRSSVSAFFLCTRFVCRILSVFVDFPKMELLVFKSTPNQPHGGHITDTKCRPDFIAAFKSEWKPENATLWPCIRLVGEDASSSDKPDDQEKHAASYLYYLLLARPDLYVTQGLLISDSKIMFLFGIGGDGVQKLSVPWESEELHRLMYAFIYRLYEPGHFADSSYVKMVPNLNEGSVTYTVRMSGNNDVTTDGDSITNLIPIYASSPFGTRTHILSNPDSKLEFKGKPMVVLKDQLCRNDTRFNEYDILTQVHDPEVPGVVEAVYHELINIPGDFCQLRTKHRLGLNQIGRPFTSIATVGQMLEIVFDILEGSLSNLFTTSCALTCCQFCGICVSSVMFFIATLAKATSCISKTIPFLQLVTMCPLNRPGRSSPSASSSTSLTRGA
jgi:hypothetical protein